LFGNEADHAVTEFRRFEKEETQLENVKSVFINLKKEFNELASTSSDLNKNSMELELTLGEYKTINEEAN
jgi:hypothetical protein